VIGYEVDDAVATITIDRPERRNALDRQHVQAILRAVARASGDEAVRAVVLTGTGGSFCSGTDMTAVDEVGPPTTTGGPTWSPTGGGGPSSGRRSRSSPPSTAPPSAWASS
jgi:enoyl-CoA hydratase/carnithine racemase